MVKSLNRIERRLKRKELIEIQTILENLETCGSQLKKDLSEMETYTDFGSWEIDCGEDMKSHFLKTFNHISQLSKRLKEIFKLDELFDESRKLKK